MSTPRAEEQTAAFEDNVLCMQVKALLATKNFKLE